MKRSPLPGRLALAALLLASTLSCDARRLVAPPDGDADAARLAERVTGVRLIVVSGNHQTGVPGAPLPEPLVVRVLDQRGRPVADAVVNWLAMLNGGTADPRQGRTDADGYARAVWTLGPGEGEQTLRASGTGGTAVFTANARLASTGVTLVKVSGDGQTGAPRETLPEPLVVRAVDSAGAPVPGVEVAWKAVRGNGTVAPGVDTTDADGLARTSWTLPAAEGSWTATASAAGAGSASFGATSRKEGAPVSLHIVPGAAWAPPGDSVQLRAVFLDAQGNVVRGPPVRWSLLAGNSASVDGKGLVRVRAQGPERVIAEAGSFTAWGEVNAWTGRTHDGVRLPSLHVLPGVAHLVEGQTMQLRAVRLEADGRVTAAKTARWESLSPGYVSITPTGLARAVSAAGAAIFVYDGALRGMSSVSVRRADGAPPPVLAGVSLSTSAADVSAAPARVRVDVRAFAADGEPAAGYRVEVASPRFVWHSCGPTGPGAPAAPECVIEIPRGAEPGTYQIRKLKVWDAAGRTAEYSLAALREAGLPSFFEVTNRPVDASPPAVVALRLDPPASGIIAGRLAVRVQASLRDPSAVTYGLLRARGPSGTQEADCRLVPVQTSLVEGAWRCDLALPESPEPGEWRVASIDLADGAGNRGTLTGDALRAQGVATAFTVGGQAAPAGLLAGFSIAPNPVRVKQAAYATAHVTNGAGAGAYVSMGLRAPNGYERHCTSQTGPDGSWSCPTVPQEGTAGTWTVMYVSVRTYDWSVVQPYDTARLRQLGFPTELVVTP